jgi:transposase
MPGGRPQKLSPEVQQRLVEAIQAANTYQAACSHAGIGYTTFATWMSRGKTARRGRFREFREAILAARARGELTLATQLRQLVTGDWRGTLALLGRRFPRRWAERQKVEAKLSGTVQHEVIVKEVIARTRDEASALLALMPKEEEG